VAQSILVALSGSFQTTPNFYLDPKSGVTYNVAIQAPQYRLDSLAQSRACRSPAQTQQRNRRSGATTAGPGRRNQGAGNTRAVNVLGNVATIVPGTELGTVSHYNVQPVLDIYTNVDGTDLGTVTRAMERIIKNHSTICRAARTSFCAGRATPCGSPTSACWAGWRFPSCWCTC
jgi:multidrug efflux pump subunit AcrB